MTVWNLVLTRPGSSIQAGILVLIPALVAAGANVTSDTTVVDGLAHYLQIGTRIPTTYGL